MLPNSEMAKNYKISATKVMYLIKHGIVEYAKNGLNSDSDGWPFTFYFDE